MEGVQKSRGYSNIATRTFHIGDRLFLARPLKRCHKSRFAKFVADVPVKDHSFASAGQAGDFDRVLLALRLNAMEVRPFRRKGR